MLIEEAVEADVADSDAAVSVHRYRTAGMRDASHAAALLGVVAAASALTADGGGDRLISVCAVCAPVPRKMARFEPV
jgi:hypothetical protein